MKLGVRMGGVRVTEAGQILEASDSVLLVDWPSTDVPEALCPGRLHGGCQRRSRVVEMAGLAYVDDTYIADAVRRLGVQK